MEHFFIDKYSELDSAIHRLDPRVKLITFLAYILFVIFTPPTQYLSFTLYAAILLLLIIISRVPIGYIIKRSLVVIPFILVIGLSMPFLKEESPSSIFWNVFSKAYLSVLCMILLSQTTKFSLLLKGLENFKIPRLIIMVLAFMYRYVFVILDEFMRTLRAKKLRTFGRIKNTLEIKALSGIIANIFIRSYERAERVYQAMCSRGFTGEIKLLKPPKLNARDVLFTVIFLLTLMIIKLSSNV